MESPNKNNEDKPTEGVVAEDKVEKNFPKEIISNGDGIPLNIPTEADIPEDCRNNYGWDDDKCNLITKEGDAFLGRYVVECDLGSGVFGKVVKAEDKFEKRSVAIKIIKNKEILTRQSKKEIAILKKLENFDQMGKYAFVHLQRDFIWRNHVCLVFEVLSQTLYNLVQRTKFRGVSLTMVRQFGYQLCEVLEFLSQPNINVMHCDLKPENIMLCNTKNTRIKLIDFGSACEVGESSDQLSRILEVVGMPPDRMIETGLKSPRYFIKTAEGYLQKKVDLSRRNRGIGTKTLGNILRISAGGPYKQVYNQMVYNEEFAYTFVDLVSRMLEADPRKRISAKEALEHPFFMRNAYEAAAQSCPDEPSTSNNDAATIEPPEKKVHFTD